LALISFCFQFTQHGLSIQGSDKRCRTIGIREERKPIELWDLQPADIYTFSDSCAVIPFSPLLAPFQNMNPSHCIYLPSRMHIFLNNPAETSEVVHIDMK